MNKQPIQEDIDQSKTCIEKHLLYFQRKDKHKY